MSWISIGIAQRYYEHSRITWLIPLLPSHIHEEERVCPQQPGGWRRRRPLTVRSRWSHYRATHSCIMHPTKLLFAGDCHLTGIRAAIADAFSIHARHCTSLMASLRFCRADYKKNTRALCAHTIRRCSVGSSSDWWITRRVRTVMVSVNRCTRYSASTRIKGSSAILKHQRILRVQEAVDIPTTCNSHDWSLLQTQPFYCCWQFNIG